MNSFNNFSRSNIIVSKIFFCCIYYSRQWHTSSWVTKGSNFCGFGDAESDALIEEANLTLDADIHRNALLKLQAKIYTDQPYVFLYSTKRKFAIHKRFANRGMYYERPGVMLQNLKLIDDFSSTAKLPTHGE